jgi:AcrR family transcriptional regulator
MTGQATRNRILDSALRLFNEHGTAAISTNHIATEAGVSPGNLYYHYRNKEEIIREILERMYGAWDGAWVVGSARESGIDELRGLIRLNFQLLWEFRFFYRESIALMLRDPELKHRHAEMQTSRLEQQARFYEQFVDSGVMRIPPDAQAIPDLVRINWILATNWLGFLEEGGIEPDEARLREGERVILRVFIPYLTDEVAAGLRIGNQS